jgi:hypothetical protein
MEVFGMYRGLCFTSALLLSITATAQGYQTYYDQQVRKHHPVKNVKESITERQPVGQFPERIAPADHRVFIFDPHQLEWAAYDSNGEFVRKGIASGGQDYCQDTGKACKTPGGTFRVYNKGGPGCVSSKFPLGRGGAPMPYCMFFKGGFAIHGAYELPNYNASHGCIRVLPSDAEWLNNNFMEIGTIVHVIKY